LGHSELLFAASWQPASKTLGNPKADLAGYEGKSQHKTMMIAYYAQHPLHKGLLKSWCLLSGCNQYNAAGEI